MFNAKEIETNQARMVKERSGFDSLWQEIGELMLPRQADFTSQRSEGAPQTNNIFDMVAAQALQQGVANFESHVMPRGSLYQMLEPADEELRKLPHVMKWYQFKSLQQLQLRNDPRSGFSHQSNESISSLLAFGPQAMWCDMRYDRATGEAVGFRYRSEHIGSIWVDEDFQGNVSRRHREFRLTAKEAVKKWPDKAPEKIKSDAANPKKETNNYTFIQVIDENPRPDLSRLDIKGKLYISAYYCKETKEVFDEGGYNSQPLIYSRFAEATHEKYARSPAMLAMPEVRAAQQIMMDLVMTSELLNGMPLLAHSDMLDRMINLEPFSMIDGALDNRGNALLKPMGEVGDPSWLFTLQDKTHEVIRRALFADMLFSNKEVKTHVNVQETMERIGEKGILLGPFARQESEWLSPLGQRELDLMDQMGLFEDMPGEVEEAGGTMQFRFENPLGRAQKSEQALGYMRLIEAMTPQMQMDPANVKIFNQNIPFEKAMMVLADVLAAPAAMYASKEEKAAQEESDQAAGSAQDLLAALPAITSASQQLEADSIAA